MLGAKDVSYTEWAEEYKHVDQPIIKNMIHQRD